MHCSTQAHGLGREAVARPASIKCAFSGAPCTAAATPCNLADKTCEDLPAGDRANPQHPHTHTPQPKPPAPTPCAPEGHTNPPARSPTAEKHPQDSTNFFFPASALSFISFISFPDPNPVILPRPQPQPQPNHPRPSTPNPASLDPSWSRRQGARSPRLMRTRPTQG